MQLPYRINIFAKFGQKLTIGEWTIARKRQSSKALINVRDWVGDKMWRFWRLVRFWGLRNRAENCEIFHRHSMLWCWKILNLSRCKVGQRWSFCGMRGKFTVRICSQYNVGALIEDSDGGHESVVRRWLLEEIETGVWHCVCWYIKVRGWSSPQNQGRNSS